MDPQRFNDRLFGFVGRITTWLWLLGISFMNLRADVVDTSGRVVFLNSNNPGTTYIGDGNLKVTSNAWLATFSEAASSELAMSGGSIQIEPGCTLINGGWQKGEWSNNKADLLINGTLDLWDGKPVYVNSLDGSGSLRLADEGSWWAGYKRIHVGVNGGGGVFSGSISSGNPDRAIEFIKEGNGIQILTNLNQQNPVRFVINGGSLEFSSESDALNSADVTGSGNWIKSGQGMLTHSGIVSHAGTNTVQHGTLRLSGGAAGNGSVRNTLVVNPSATVVFADDGTGLGFNTGGSRPVRRSKWFSPTPLVTARLSMARAPWLRSMSTQPLSGRGRSCKCPLATAMFPSRVMASMLSMTNFPYRFPCLNSPPCNQTTKPGKMLITSLAVLRVTMTTTGWIIISNMLSVRIPPLPPTIRSTSYPPPPGRISSTPAVNSPSLV